ncbi:MULTISPECIES: DUF2946 family protein [unclassified Pseudomonas]|uniref:DUF2946 family protein n=1 Tax=unclassified Pseudomonas TaxID=196821 RepID=UPI002448A047|nr:MULTISPECIES: DUF2946 family protein [unclassified Pseudomonas]MDG9923363.1 DUF2946 family protein [Pseudomonas sp. GD04045]MDH0035513.1 DUF2946 family protein [Pseudomonas sp. GD04019]
MPSTRHLQSIARLALLAMFLLLAAPLFSQSLAAAAAPAWLSEMACGEGGHDQLPHDAPPWAQCGYCTLLLTSPALTGLLHGLQGATVFAAVAPLPALSSVLQQSVTPHDAPPRAPPHAFA